MTVKMRESEDNEIGRGRLKLAERYLHFEETAAAWNELPKLKAYLEAVGADQCLVEKEKMARVQAVLFGPRRRKKPSGWKRTTQKRGVNRIMFAYVRLCSPMFA